VRRIVVLKGKVGAENNLRKSAAMAVFGGSR